MESLSVIVLSGGFSRRMGMEKGLVLFSGQPMIQKILEIAAELTNNILIIANNEGYEQFGYPVHHDILKEKGPIGGIHSGLSHSKAVHNLVLACDLPMLTTDFLKYIIEQTEEQDQIVVPRQEDQIEPLCAIYHKNCLAELEKACHSPDLSLHGFIAQNNAKFIEINEHTPYYSPYLFSNANNLEDLRALESVKE